ncbi:ran GTPase-activating protein 1-like [Vanessa cardui]|uniref:ran GTPase-activating protein 1-like n=1 Tax=Vanessa cardui TaxID=171605 RepID=UPI001F13A0AD|nr:ran GTPase-activating protein 1-like [Vanessa cardui]
MECLIKQMSVDLSHNEIGREACMELVDALTAPPGSARRLARVVLAGNSLGGAANKTTMKSKLGASAELSDGEGSEDEYVSGSDDDDEESDLENSEDSATEDAQHFETSLDAETTLEETDIVREVETDVGKFLREPTLDNLAKLGPNAADVIDVHLQVLFFVFI